MVYEARPSCIRLLLYVAFVESKVHNLKLASLLTKKKRRLKYSVTLGAKNEFFNTIVVFILIFDATLRAEALRSSSK